MLYDQFMDALKRLYPSAERLLTQGDPLIRVTRLTACHCFQHMTPENSDTALLREQLRNLEEHQDFLFGDAG